MIEITNDSESLEQLKEYGNDIEYYPLNEIPIEFGEDQLYFLYSKLIYKNISRRDFKAIVDSLYEPEFDYYECFNDYDFLSELKKIIESVEGQNIKPDSGYIKNVYHSSNTKSFYYKFGEENNIPVLLKDTMDLTKRNDIEYISYLDAKPEFFRGLSLIDTEDESTIKKIKISNLNAYSIEDWNLNIIYTDLKIKDFNLVEYSQSFDCDKFLEKLMKITTDNIDLNKYIMPGVKRCVEIPIEIDNNEVDMSFILYIKVAE